MSTVATDGWRPEDEGAYPERPPITEAEVQAFVARLGSFPDAKHPELPRWPWGVRCQGRCACHCNHTNCACHERAHQEGQE